MPPVNTKPNVQVTLNGLLVVFVDPQNTQCRVGVLRQAPGNHTFNIKVVKADANGVFQPFAEIKEADIKNKLELTVSNTTKTGISRRKMNLAIDRKNGPTIGNRDSFRWVVDFEKDIYKKPIGAKKSGFASILTMNNGELLARNLSENELIIKKGLNDPGVVFGKVATKTGIDIVLDKPNSKAVFKNGNKIVFKADKQSRFQILISRGCDNQPGGNDADSYYTALGHLVPDSEKIFFSSTPLPAGVTPPIDPDAACLNTQMSQSQPGS